MGWAERVLAPQQRDGGDYVTDDDHYAAVDNALLGRPTDSSEIVDAESAIRHTAVFAAISLRADTVGGLPLITYEKTGRRRLPAVKTDAYRLLAREPNPEMAPIDLLSRLEAHLSAFGEAFIAKEMAGQRVDALWPIDPDRVIHIRRQGGRRIYTIAGRGRQTKELDGRYVIHIKLLALSGLRGLSPIALHRETIGGAIALDRYGHRVFRNGAILRGVIRMKGTLTSGAKTEFKRQWRALHSQSRQHGVAILDEDADYKPIAMPLQDAQYVELKKLSVAEIARILFVPASMIGGGTADGSLTYRTVEGDALNFLKFGLQGRSLARITQGFMRDRDLFPDPETRYCAFKTDELLRPDTLKRYQAYAVGLKQRFLTVNEVREDDDRDPIEGGDELAPATPPPAAGPATEETVPDAA